MFYIFKEKMFQRCCSAFSQAILKHWLECKYILNHEVSDDLLDFRMARTVLEKTLNCHLILACKIIIPVFVTLV